MHHLNSPPQAHIASTGRSHLLWWLLGIFGAFLVLGCGGIFAAIAYIGTVAPDTSVYTGNRVPKKYVQTAREVGALDEDENILYFYSDAILDIREGFYFVSNKKVVIYSTEFGEAPLLAIPFDAIETTEFHKDDSFLMDSEIVIETKSGQVCSFPVSSEFGLDEKFYAAVRDRTAKSNGG